eukprot:scaffold225655_cov42-Prasinocladus_malaysianus.AAC.1
MNKGESNGPARQEVAQLLVRASSWQISPWGRPRRSTRSNARRQTWRVRLVRTHFERVVGEGVVCGHRFLYTTRVLAEERSRGGELNKWLVCGSRRTGAMPSFTFLGGK